VAGGLFRRIRKSKNEKALPAGEPVELKTYGTTPVVFACFLKLKSTTPHLSLALLYLPDSMLSNPHLSSEVVVRRVRKPVSRWWLVPVMGLQESSFFLLVARICVTLS